MYYTNSDYVFSYILETKVIWLFHSPLEKVVPESVPQDPKDVVDSEILEEKPKIIILFIKKSYR